MKRTLFFLILCSLSLQSFSSAEKVTELQNNLKNAKDDTSRINVYKDFITLYIVENMDSAIHYIEQGKLLANKMKDPKSLGIMYNAEARMRSYRGMFDLAKSAELKALELFYNVDYKKGIATSYNSLGVIEAKTGDYKLATSYFLRSLKMNEEIKNTGGIIQNYISLGSTNSQLDLLDKANAYFFKAMKMMPDSISMTFLNLCNNIGIIYGKKNDYELSLYYFNRGLKVADKVINGQTTKASLLMNAAIAYANINRTDLALKYYNEALELSRKYNLLEDEARVLYNIAILYETSDPELAKKYYYKVLELAKEMGQKHLMVEVYQSLYIIYKEQKEYKLAIEALEQFHNYQDTVMSLENTSAIELLQSNYDLEKSKVEIKELEMANQKQRSNQIIAFLLIGGSLFSLGLVAWNSRKRNLLNIELKKSITVRDKLLSIITHDLKSPINNVLGLLGELEGNELSEEDRKMLLDVLKKQTSMSLDTLENILKWGQSQMRGLKSNPQKFDLTELMKKNIDFFDVNLKSKKIGITNHINQVNNVYADYDQIDFVIRNVLSNAIKFSNPDSFIEISVDTKYQNQVRLSIKDNGSGMNEETLKSLFGVKQKINIGTANEKGSGLGLLLCKEFMEANNGKIWAESKENEGSVFYMAINAA
jgi:signal transduction histidine kinase